MAINGISVQEHLEKLFDEFKKRYESEQKSQDDRFKDFKDNLNDRDKILAEKVKADLATYPTILDFNELREKVTIEFSSDYAKDKMRLYIISIVGLLIGIVTVIVLIWSKWQ